MIVMSFKVGRRVEVLTKKKNPSGDWRCAEIVAANRDSYMVKYYRGTGVAKEGVDKVPAEVVRPCQPPSPDSMIWIVGEIVEVLDDGYWKVSRIEEDFRDGYYQIHVIGSIDEFRVKKSNIRERREWKEGQWILMDQDSGAVKDTCRKPDEQRCDDHCQVVPDSAPLSKSLKRSSSDKLSGGFKKQRAMEKEATVDIFPGDSYSYIGKVDPPHLNGNNDQCNACVLTKKTTMSNNINQRTNDETKFLARATEPADAGSFISSVASCSVIDAISDRVRSHSSAGFNQDNDSLCSDAESLDRVGDKERVSFKQSKGEDALRSHELDLHSYRCILEALYASGPLSWEQELYLTNLRMKCYVSNDEHLSELRRLKCSVGLGLSCH